MNHAISSTTSAVTPEPPRPSASGLEDVVAAVTRLSDVDGEAGRLILAGRPVETLAGRVPFEHVCHLLLRGSLPSPTEAADVSARLHAGRVEGYESLRSTGARSGPCDAMDRLRAWAAALSARPGETPFDEALRITGAVGMLAAASANPGVLPAPRREASHAEDYLRAVTGREPTDRDVRALDAYLVTVVDHGMNASTFTARVVASTGSDVVSAVVAALGALKGPLHGGAPGPVLDMLDAVGDAARARPWLEAQLARGERIMGMGHRVYRVRDPRAFVLERALARLEEERGAISGRLALARAVEAEAEALLARRHPTRPLKANVEFYTAVLLEAVGIPRTAFTPTFAASRVLGWCAHVDEQRRHGRLIRPASRFVDVPPAP